MNKIFTPKLTIILIFICIIISTYFISINFCDNKVTDLFTRTYVHLFNKKASENIVLVVIDNKSLDKIKWPWSRDIISDIFDYLEFICGAKVIVFHNLVVFPDTYNPKSDAYFYKNLSLHNKLINSYILLNSNLTGDVLPPEFLEQFAEKSNINIIDKRINKNISAYKGVIKLPKDFLKNVKILGSSIIQEDKDENVRNYMPVVQLNDKLLPSIALSAYSLYSDIYSFTLNDDFLCSYDDCKSLKIPIFTRKGRDYIGNSVFGILSHINWYKPISDYYTHNTYSAIDVIDSYNAYKNGIIPKLSSKNFKDKIVVIGLNADKNVWEQLSETPVLKKHADIDVHATVIDNMINNSFLSTIKDDFTLLITFIFSILVIWGFKNFKYNLLFTTMLSLIYFSYFVFQYNSNILIPPFTPIVTLYVCAFLKKIYSLITTDKTTEMIKHAMGKYISKDVMKKVLLNLDKLKLGGTRTVVTILFVDIRNFTKISEELSPQDVTSILNEYFSTIEPIIAKYHGIVNKYMGDGVLAIFGEPIKCQSHALNAISCGVEIIKNVKILREKLIKDGKPKIEIGIGINTGEVFAGNIGTEERFEYTIIGDNVNLAYRIEAYNQILKTQFLISEYTYEFVKNYVDVVKLTHVTIKGKSKPINIYEVLNIKNKND